MDTSEPGDAQAPQEAGATPSTKADPLALQKVESLKEQVRLPVADSYNNLGAIAATNSDYSSAVTVLRTFRNMESIARRPGL